MSFEILGVDLYHILSWFIVYSFMGWIWESCYVSAKSKKWVNRGFVSGPFVTIYGVGAVTVYVILRPVAGNILELYFAGVAVATILEYVTGVLMEAIFHTNWWDYSDKKFNFQGKICLGSSVAWGFFTLILFYIFQPFVGNLVEMVPRKTGIVLVYIWLAGYTVDFAFSAVNLTEQHLYYYKKGKVVLDTPFVSGRMTKDRFTPPGVYFLTYKQKDRILRGRPNASGQPSYQSHVNYWMPFNGGIGLHDASWRSSFGGKIYIYSGSHGCINLPGKKAAKIYEMINKETPIVCVYNNGYKLHG